LTKINVVVCNPNAIAWCTRKSPGPIVKNREFLLLLIASSHPGSQILLPALTAILSELDRSILNPYSALPELA